MKTNLGETLLVGLTPLIMDIAELQAWIVVTAGIVTIFWVLYQLIRAIKQDFFTKKKSS